MHVCTGNTDCVSTICCTVVSSSWTRSGRSPLDRPDRYLVSVSRYDVWFTSETCTSLCWALNRSVRRLRSSSFARVIECHITIRTGLAALTTDPIGQAARATLPGPAVPVVLVPPPPPPPPHADATSATAAASTSTDFDRIATPGSAGDRQPFNAPAVSPRTSCFWNTTS